jgi:hypothetical protein
MRSTPCRVSETNQNQVLAAISGGIRMYDRGRLPRILPSELVNHNQIPYNKMSTH